MKKIKIIGAGLAGSEAALYLAEKGYQVSLYEQRPVNNTLAHKTPYFAELVCSNSLKSMLLTTASGLLKKELEIMGSKLLPIAQKFAVPAGSALAIDRNKFAEHISKIINNHPNIKVFLEEVKTLDDELTIISTGPLTSPNMIDELKKYLPSENLYFYDAIAPIIEADSINREIVYEKSRYDKGEANYLNCPFSKEEYFNFVENLLKGEKVLPKEFEKKYIFYENCIPIEELANRGKETLRYGVLRAIGLENADGKRPYAVMQLRAENKENTAYNLVGCQTMLKYSAQKEIFRLVPGLEKAEFLRYGNIHRNTYINSPLSLNANLSLKNKENVFIAGQLSGTEGYVEAIFSGLLIAKIICENLQSLPSTTISANLWKHLLTKTKNYQPQNANFGILPPLDTKIKDKKLKKEEFAKRSLEDLEKYFKL